MERPVHQVLQRLQEMNAPARFSAETWRQLIADARNFFDRWSQHADLLGWTDEDLVGVHPAAPMARYDAMGLLLLMRGGEVTHLRQDSAVIRALSGVSLVYRKAPHSAAVPVWQL
jgi:hypothetical protein